MSSFVLEVDQLAALLLTCLAIATTLRKLLAVGLDLQRAARAELAVPTLTEIRTGARHPQLAPGERYGG